MRSIDQENAPQTASYQPGREARRHRKHLLQEPLQPGAGVLQAFAPGGIGDIRQTDEHTPDADLRKRVRRVDVGKESSKQIAGRVESATAHQRFEGTSLGFQIGRQTGDDVLQPEILLFGFLRTRFWYRTMMGKWHGVSPDPFSFRIFKRYHETACHFLFLPLFS
jgi:hypothetical protein